MQCGGFRLSCPPFHRSASLYLGSARSRQQSTAGSCSTYSNNPQRASLSVRPVHAGRSRWVLAPPGTLGPHLPVQPWGLPSQLAAGPHRVLHTLETGRQEAVAVARSAAPAAAPAALGQRPAALAKHQAVWGGIVSAAASCLLLQRQLQATRCLAQQLWQKQRSITKTCQPQCRPQPVQQRRRRPRCPLCC